MKPYLIDELSVFYPCYNEEKNIKSTVAKTIPVLKKITGKWEIILVNDGSKDNTAAVLTSIKKQFPQQIKIITHNPNRGYGGAVKSGLYNSKYKWITFTDSDGQFDFGEVVNLIKKQQQTQADIVIGYYLSRQVSKLTILTSKIWELIVFILFGLKVTDIDCAFKLIRKKVVDTIPKLESERGAFISSEFLIKAKKAGFKIAEVGVHHYPRTEGQATGRNLKVILKSFSDLFRLWYKINFKRD
ncbi:MAG TPA: glycosyltransferase family 2 protein [Candidatus Woesebacteria bacterium]|jgi:glycosyltransferase involved in cell wall biosynthesis|nr:glycosyltransferase family 2 protein [Candidatus Woesebacteria bacterium]HOG37313.1 glycosyltransferase family 2 protein [Candidatus Woesebacteria bacterium]